MGYNSNNSNFMLLFNILATLSTHFNLVRRETLSNKNATLQKENCVLFQKDIYFKMEVVRVRALQKLDSQYIT